MISNSIRSWLILGVSCAACGGAPEMEARSPDGVPAEAVTQPERPREVSPSLSDGESGKSAQPKTPEEKYALAVQQLGAAAGGTGSAQAIEWLSEAAESGHLEAQLELGRWYGDQNHEDLAKSAAWFLRAAAQGSPRAQYVAAGNYKAGRGIERSDKQALEWYERAAEQNFALAQWELGLLYNKGEGVVAKDLKRAVALFRKAAEQGLAKAQNSMGYVYDFGEGVGKDVHAAHGWYLKAAEQGYAPAQYNVGYNYDNGVAVNQDDAVAVEWYRKAAEQDYVPAKRNLAKLYDEGSGVKQDYAAAAKLYGEAIDGGDVGSLTSLGILYYFGRGVPKDGAEAASLFQLAADQGHAHGQFVLGLLYDWGEGVAQNAATAAKWTQLAADQGHKEAMVSLALMLRYGRSGLARDLNRARELLQAAKKGGAERAGKLLEELDSYQRCSQGNKTELFGSALRCANREDLRAAIRAQPIGVKLEDLNNWGDTYTTSKALTGSTELYLGYTHADEFAVAEYQFPDMDVIKFAERIGSKYGRPAKAIGNAEVGPVTFTWRRPDGIEIEVHRNWPWKMVFLRYYHPTNYAKMKHEQKALQRRRELDQYRKESEAF